MSEQSPKHDALVEEGRRLASRRDDLIAAGIDPAEPVVPTAPDNDTCWCDGPDCGQAPCIEVAAPPPASDVYSDNAAAGGAEGLAEALQTRHPDGYDSPLQSDHARRLVAEMLLASGWLAARDARVLREAADAMPRGISNRRGAWLWLRNRAIAAERNFADRIVGR